MIPELDRFHGIVLRQILVARGAVVPVGTADVSGRVDSFYFDGAAFQIKHSSKRLSPWRFTYVPEHLTELNELRLMCDPVWVFFVCGGDGVVGLSSTELATVLNIGGGGAAWIRITRSRNSMYRVAGARGELPRAKPRGVEEFLATVAAARSRVEPQ